MVTATGQALLDAVNDTHRHYYDSSRWNLTWLGVPIAKNPMDLWAVQELIVARRPTIIVETGTQYGGSALYYACLCELLRHGRVLTVDNAPSRYLPPHHRLTYLLGDSVSARTLAEVAEWAGDDHGMVILDSDHARDHVLAELDAYSPWVGIGEYLIVEDTNIGGHPAFPHFGPGPFEAIQDWLPQHPELVVDRRVEPFLSFNPGGYLRRLE